MVIRGLTYTDLPAVRRAYAAFTLEQQQGRPNYPGMDEEELDSFVLQVVRALPTPTFRCWIAEGFGGTLLGFLGASIEERACGKPHRFGYVHWLWVNPDHRGEGIGKALGRALSEWYLPEKIEVVEVRELAGDGQWQRRGWQPISVHLAAPTAHALAWARGELPASQSAPAPKATRQKRPARVRVQKKTQQINGADHAR